MILVVTADDAGVDAPRNRGILRAARDGIVRSASVLVTFPAAAEFIEEARALPALGIGLHLDLTEGSPLVAGHRSLAGADGRFLGKRELWRRAEAGLIDEREAEREIEAQWRRLVTLGARPAHADGHHHAHLLPGIAGAFGRVLPAGTWARRAGKSHPPRVRTEDPYESPEVLAGALAALDGGIEWPRLRSPDRHAGLELPDGYSAGDLIRLLRAIDKEGPDVVELMTHPGEACEGSVPFSASPDREREIEALACDCIRAFVETQGIRLASFGLVMK